MATITVTCSRCKQPIDTTEGYIVTGEELQFTNLPDPKLEWHEEALHFACPDTTQQR
jgi:hypothetical protein